MLALATRVFDDADLAGDVVGEVFLDLWQRRGERFPENPVAWLLRTTRLRALDRHRSRRARAEREEAWARDAGRAPRSPLDEAEAHDLGTRIEDAIQSLPSRRKQAFELVVVKGKSVRSAGGVMSAAEKSVENYVRAARLQLQALLRECAVEWLGVEVPEPTSDTSDVAPTG